MKGTAALVLSLLGIILMIMAYGAVVGLVKLNG